MYYIYILASQTNRVVYVGVTNDLVRRVYEHKGKLVEGFTKRYNINKLVYFEQTSDVESAILREKQLKTFSRNKKNRLINHSNPEWKDLYFDLL